jgi:hypothetical protein
VVVARPNGQLGPVRDRCAAAVVNPSVHFVLPSSNASINVAPGALHSVERVVAVMQLSPCCVPNEHIAGSLPLWPSCCSAARAAPTQHLSTNYDERKKNCRRPTGVQRC